MGKFGGVGAGGAISLPFIVVVSPKGIPLINSKRPVPGKREGADIDYPLRRKTLVVHDHVEEGCAGNDCRRIADDLRMASPLRQARNKVARRYC